MALVLSEDHQLLQETAARFIADKSPVTALRALRDSHNADGFERSLWLEMAALDWPGLVISAEYAGAEFGYLGLGVVLEESGRTLTASPLISTALLGACCLSRLGTQAQKRALLPAIASGKHLTALALEEGTRHAPFNIGISAIADADGFVLNGSKRFVLDGHVADTLIVVARTAEGRDNRDGLTLFLVDPSSVGIEVTRTWMVDSRNAANVELTNVAVPAQAVLGGNEAIGKSGAALEEVLDVARTGLAAEMLGGMRETFKRTLQYLKLRGQFGVKIGSFQASKHRAAIMVTEIELVSAAVRAALVALDENSADIALLASLAKAKANEAAFLVSNEGLQMHGGIGMTDEEEIGFFLKRARVAQQTFGDARYHRDRYARLCEF